MQDLLNAPYQIFTAAVLFVFSLSLIEVILFFIGSSSSSLFQDSDVDLDIDIDADVDIDFDLDVTPEAVDLFEVNPDSIQTPASFFNIGKVPFFVVILSIGITFGLFGILLHKLFASWGVDLSTFVSIPLSTAFAAVATWGITNAFSKILPGEENYAIEEESFISREAIVEEGEGNSEIGVMVSFVDEFGTTHRLLGTVPIEGVTVKAGDRVVILNKNNLKGGFYILPSFEALMEQKMEDEKKAKDKQDLKEMTMTM